MAWKKYREGFINKAAGENLFILGLDLGDASSAIATYNHLRGESEIVDMSGGYGKASSPTVIQYIPDSTEWIFGEYAVLNRGQGGYISLENLVGRLGRAEFAEIGGRPISVVSILGMYVKELVGSLRNINPRAELAGFSVAVPGYMSESAQEELLNVLKAAGLRNRLVSLPGNIECVLRYYFERYAPARERVLLVDFGNREVRAGVYALEPRNGSVDITALSSLFDGELGVGAVNEAIYGMLTGLYREHYGLNEEPEHAVREQLHAFAYQHRDLLFQKNFGGKPVKLYYNFAYPPFSAAVSQEDMERLIEPFKRDLLGFLQKVAQKTTDGAATGIDTIICTGGGFEMLWARRAVAEAFPGSRVVLFKDSKGAAAAGAAICAAIQMGACPAPPLDISDPHKLESDIGVMVRKNGRDAFIPLVERNSFWWQEREPRDFILTEDTAQGAEFCLFRRDGHGGVTPFGRLALGGLPDRPAGTTRLSLSPSCPVYNRITVKVTDMGFGELFPAEGYAESFDFAL